MQRIAIIVPAHNEARNIRPLFEQLTSAFNNVSDISWSLLVVDDGSTDNTIQSIQELCDAYDNVACLELSRNFGKEAALSAGIVHAEGDAMILMDADLQHPPAVIPEMIERWRGGADVVIGVRAENPDEGFLRRRASALFANLMRALSDVPTVSRATDFRLIDRAVAEEFKRFTERGRITRGLIDWLGFKRALVPFNAQARYSGSAQYGPRKLIRLAVSALVSHSLLPLKSAGYLGVAITVLSGALGIFIIIEQLILGDPIGMEVSGTAMLAVMILFLNGILLMSIGLTSLYIANIHNEAVNRPLFVVRKKRKI